MPDNETPAQRYLRLAKECFDGASAFSDGEQRDALLQMAQAMNEQAVQERQVRVFSIAEVAFYLIVVLVIMVLSVYVPA